MSKSLDYKDEEQNSTLGLQTESQVILSPNFVKLSLIFQGLAQSFSEKNLVDFLANLTRLAECIPDALTFHLFLLRNGNKQLFELFEHTSCILENSDNETKETIANLYGELIVNNDFATLFSQFNGDLLFANYFQNISEKYDNLSLMIFTHMKLSANFPIWFISDFFKDKPFDFRFIGLFIKLIDNTTDIDQLFTYLDLFPGPHKESFALFCQLLILFLKNKVNEALFVDKDHLRQLSDLLPFVDVAIATHFLQIIARLSNSHVEVLHILKPELLFLFLVNKSIPEIIIPTTTIINAMMCSEIFMSKPDFVRTFVNQDVVFSLLEILSEYQFPFRIRALVLINSFISSSDYAILGLLLHYNEAKNGCELSDIIYSLLGSDDADILIATLQFSYHIIIGVQRINDDDASIIGLVAQWKNIGIDSVIDDLINNEEPNIAQNAELVYSKLRNYLQLVEE